MNSASTRILRNRSFIHQLSRKLESTFVVFLGNKKAQNGAVHQFSNNDVEDDIANINVEPL